MRWLSFRGCRVRILKSAPPCNLQVSYDHKGRDSYLARAYPVIRAQFMKFFPVLATVDLRGSMVHVAQELPRVGRSSADF